MKLAYWRWERKNGNNFWLRPVKMSNLSGLNHINMHFILLDGAQGFLIFIPVLFILHLVFTFLVEGAMLRWFDYGTWKKCFKDALIANLSSLVMGLLLMLPFGLMTRNVEDQTLWLLVLFYLQTIICEGIALRLLNDEFPWKKLIWVTLLMNLITYIPIYFLVR